MREIKFRYIYQRKEDPDLPEFSLQIADPKDSTWTLEQISEGEPDNYISVCLSSSWKVIAINQYTGLKDKNGKEIYEGDILQRFQKNGKPYNKKYIVPPILYMVDSLRYFSDFNFEEHKKIIYDLGNKEVIGNIYENPELLKK